MVARSTGILNPLLRLLRWRVAPVQSGPACFPSMDNLRRLPQRQVVLVDERGVSLRLTWHAERDQVVLSVWHDGVCAASFRLPVEEAPQVAGFLRPASQAARVLPLEGAFAWARQRLARLRRHLRRSA